MPTVRVPLAGSFNQRGIDGEQALTVGDDQRFLNCVFTLASNPLTGKNTVYVEKRPGWGQDTLVTAGNNSTGLIRPQSLTATMSAFGNTNSTIYFGTTSVGTITGRVIYFGETIISSTSYILIRSSDGTGWYYAEDAKDNLAYTADGNNSTTITDIKVGGVNSVAGLYVGQKLTAGANIVAGSRIVSINAGAFSAVLDTATTGGAFNDLAITKEPVAKIIDADFTTTGTYISGFAEMDGYVFYTTDDGNVRNSDLNSIVSYSATAFKAADMSPDPPVAIGRSKNMIMVFGTGSVQGFYNNGYATGSPLERSTQTFSRIGAQGQSAVSVLENDIFFAGSSNYGDIQAWRIRDFAPQKISTPFVDRIMGTLTATGGQTYTSSFQLGGYPYAMFTMSTSSDGPAELLLLESGDEILLEDGNSIQLEGNAASLTAFGRQLVYNAALNIWGEWDASVATFVSGQGAGSNNNILATSRFSTSGKVYRINPAADGELYQDDGSAYTMQIRTSKVGHGTNKRKFDREIRLIADTQSAGTATLEASDDDYQTWHTLGTFDLTQAEKKITRCGSYKGERAYRLSHSYNGPFRAEALEIEFEVRTI